VMAQAVASKATEVSLGVVNWQLASTLTAEGNPGDFGYRPAQNVVIQRVDS